MKDFLNLFSATVENAEINESENSLNLTWNFPMLSFGKGRNSQLQVMVHEASVYTPLEMAIPEGQRTARAAALKQQLDDSSDVTATFSFSVVNQRFGRSFVPHRDFYAPLFSKIVNTTVIPSDNARANNLANIVSDLSTLTDLPADFADKTELEKVGEAIFNASPPPSGLAEWRGSSANETVTTLIANLEELFGAEAALTGRVQKALGGHPIRGFSNLINNQPQLSFTASYRDRDEYVGPNQTAIKVTYEKGLFNLNSLKSYLDDKGEELSGCETMMGPAATEGATNSCMAAITTYAQRVLPYLDDANRFTFTASYNETDAYDVSLPASDDPMYSAVSVNQEKVEKLIASLAYGRVLTNDGQGQPVSRFDLEAKYEDIVDGETLVDNRLIVTAIYTRELSDQFSLPLSLVWANKDEFLPDVDEKFSANFGIRFRVKGKDMPMTPPGDDSGS